MAATLFSRPTPRGTTSFGKTTASRSGTRGRSFGNWFACELGFVVVVSGSVTSSFLLAVDGRARMSMELSKLNALLALARTWLAIRRFVRCFDRQLRLGPGILAGELVRDLVQEVRRVTELEQELHARKIDSAGLREVPDRPNALEVFVGVQADVRVRSHRIEQALLLVDTERPGMAPGQARRDADDVHRSPRACHANI